MFAQIDWVVPPAVSGQNGLFMVESLPGASCQVWRNPVAGDNKTWRSWAEPMNADGWYYYAWGAHWTAAKVTVTVYVTCTAAAPDTRNATSANVNVFWPPLATPAPSVATPAPSAF
jgi:hypothetical protein